MASISMRTYTPALFALSLLVSLQPSKTFAENGIPEKTTLEYPTIKYSVSTESFESTLPYEIPFFIEVELYPNESKGLTIAWATKEAKKNHTKHINELIKSNCKPKDDKTKSLINSKKIKCLYSSRPQSRTKEKDSWRVLVTGDPDGHEGLRFREEYTFFIGYEQQKYSKSQVDEYIKTIKNGYKTAMKEYIKAKKSNPKKAVNEFNKSIESIDLGKDSPPVPKEVIEDAHELITPLNQIEKHHLRALNRFNIEEINQFFGKLSASKENIEHSESTTLLRGYKRKDLVAKFKEWPGLNEKERQNILSGRVDLQFDSKEGLVWKPLDEGYSKPVALCQLSEIIKTMSSLQESIHAPNPMNTPQCHTTKEDTLWHDYEEAWAAHREVDRIFKKIENKLIQSKQFRANDHVEQVELRQIGLKNPNTVNITTDIGIGFISLHEGGTWPDGKTSKGSTSFFSPMVGISVGYGAEDKRVPLNIFDCDTNWERTISMVFGVTASRLQSDTRTLRGLISDQVTPYLGVGFRPFTSFRISAGLIAAEAQTEAPLNKDWSLTVGGFIRASVDLDIYNLIKDAVSSF